MRWWPAAAAAALLVVGAAVLVPARDQAGGAEAAARCPASVKVGAATSFLPVLDALRPALVTGRSCLGLDVVPVDGRYAGVQAAASGVDLWIPDDEAWAAAPGGAALAAEPVAHAGATVAVSPLYLVTDQATADEIGAAGGGWLGLAGLLGTGRATMAIRDPAAAGDGLLAAGAIGEAMSTAAGRPAAATALAALRPSTRTVAAGDPVLPRTAGEVGVVPEHALLPVLHTGAADLAVIAPADHTSALRYTWLPTAAAAADPAVSARLEQLWEAMTGAGSSSALATAGLRRPGIGLPPGARPGELPTAAAPLFDVLAPDRVDQVFAGWYPDDRLSDVLAVVDVSGSMAAASAGAGPTLLDLARTATVDIADLLPDDARFGLWEFGVDLGPDSDHRVLIAQDTLDPAQRAAVATATPTLAVQRTGSGLHDTVLAAYLAGRDSYRPGVPDHVVVLTDGHDEADPDSLTRQQLVDQLLLSKDPARPVDLTVLILGDQADAATLAEALAPTGAVVSHVADRDAARAAFLDAIARS